MGEGERDLGPTPTLLLSSKPSPTGLSCERWRHQASRGGRGRGEETLKL